MASWKRVLLEGLASIGDLSDVTISSASNAQILVHDGTDFDNVSVSGDVTIANDGAVTIAADAVTNAKLANMTQGTIKVGGGSNAPTDLNAKTSGQIIVGDGTDVVSVAVSGDVTLAASGAVTIENDAVTNAKLANIARGSIKVGGGSNAPTDLDASGDGKILVGDGTDINSVAVSGDVGLANDGAVTIQADAVTFAKMQNMAEGAVLGRASSGTGIVEQLGIDQDLSTVSATHDTVASAKAIKEYVDTQVAAGYDLDISADSGSNIEITNAETLDLEGTANQISTTTGTNKVTFSIPSAFTAPGSIASTSTITAATGLTVSNNGAAITGNSTVTGTLNVTSDLTVGGSLTVEGTTTFLDTANVKTIDKVIRLAIEDSGDNDYADAATAVSASSGSGIEVVTDTIANSAKFAQLVWNNNTTTMTGWSIRDTGASQTVYGIAALDRGTADPTTTPTTGALFYNDGTAGTEGLYLYTTSD